MIIYVFNHIQHAIVCNTEPYSSFSISPVILLKLLLRNLMTAVLSQGSGDNTASVRIHFGVNQKWAIHILHQILPWPSYS